MSSSATHTARRAGSAPVLQLSPESSPKLFSTAGPICSIYLQTDGAQAQASDKINRQWRSMRDQLHRDGAPEAALTAVDPLVDGAYKRGHTLAAISSAEGLLYHANLPQDSQRNTAKVGSLPCLLPLFQATQDLMPYVVVATDRLGAELIAVIPGQDDQHETVAGGELHVTRSAPGGWSQRRFQQRAENTWEENARDVAEELTKLVDRCRPRLVVVSGDVRAVQFLRDHVPARVSELLEVVQGEYQSVDEAMSRSEELVARTAAQDVTDLVADFNEQQQTNGRAVAGPDETLAALQAGQVQTLLIDENGIGDAEAWYGAEPAQVAGSEDALTAMGVSSPQSGPLADVAVRAALATSAEVRVLPPGAADLAHGGIAAILRYR